MSINQKLLGKGIQKLLLLILLFIVSPVTLNIAFKAFDKMEDAIIIPYALLLVAILLVIFTIILAFKTFKTLLDALFNSGKN